MKNIKRIALVFGGAILGYSYYYYIGCNGGGCPITGNPYISTAYGALLGVILAMPSKKEIKNGNNKEH